VIGAWCLLAGTDRPKLVCKQVRYEANVHETGVSLQCLVRSHPAINASQAVYSWSTLSGRNDSITAGQRDGHHFAHLRPGVCLYVLYRKLILQYRSEMCMGPNLLIQPSIKRTYEYLGRTRPNPT